MAERGWEPLPFPVLFEEAEPALEALLALPQPPTAVCCWNDLTALNLLHGCRSRGLRVPSDLAVAGFDGLLDMRITAQVLTTVTAFWPDVTLRALDTLHRQMHGEKASDVITLPVELREGETT
jgi:DNA-binding LacI/PurR family transcriptional regulator